jgi:hypothetical protein
MMITLYLKRDKFGSTYTIGTLKTPKQSFITCEDKFREEFGVPVTEWKVPGETAIPVGMYPLILDMSTRFEKIMPHVLNVEGFEGIRIHAGNTSSDTEGCILLGWTEAREPGMILNSRKAVDDFMDEIQVYYDRNEPVQIEIA